MALFALGLVMAPFVAGWAGVRVTHVVGKRAFAAWLLGAALFVFSAWFGGRVDERPVEGVLAGLGVAICILGLWHLRRSNQTQKAGAVE